MYCPDCNHSYQTEDDVCPYCNSNNKKAIVKDEKAGIKIVLLKSICVGGLSCLIWSILLEIILNFRKFIIVIPKDEIVSGKIFMFYLFFSSIILPISLSIYNLYICIKHKNKLYIINFIFVEIFTVLSWIINVILLNYFDKQIFFASDRRQEVTGSAFLVIAFLISIIFVLVLGIINQIILILANKKVKNNYNEYE